MWEMTASFSNLITSSPQLSFWEVVVAAFDHALSVHLVQIFVKNCKSHRCICTANGNI